MYLVDYYVNIYFERDDLMGNKYYIEIEHLIKKNEVNRQVRKLQNNSEDLDTKWNIGRLFVEAQGGRTNIKYGNALIKEWSLNFEKDYGKKYNYSNLYRYRQFYLTFPNFATVWQNLSWSLFKIIMPIKSENERNYYINICLEQNLSTRELERVIKEKTYDRLIDKPSLISIKTEKLISEKNIKYNLKNPILIKLNKNESLKSERELQLKILSQLQSFFFTTW